MLSARSALRLLAAALALRRATGGASAATIVVHADAVIVAGLAPSLVGHGIEDVNHELIGGIAVSMVFGESFEEAAGPGGVSGAAGGAARATWAALAPVPPQCAFTVAVGDAFNGAQSQIINSSSSSSSSACAIANRGLDSGGMSFAPGVSYALQLFAKRVARGAPSVPLDVALYDSASSAVVASATLAVESSSWTRLSATLAVPAAFAGTVCAQDAAPLVPCYANAESLCISCSGSLTIALPVGAAGAVALDQVSLVAQSGGPGPADGLPASRRDVAALIGPEGFGGSPGMGLSALRLGGSMTNAAAYLWKTFRGPPELRRPYKGTWYGPPSSSSYGFFEFLQLCEATSTVALCVTSMNSAETLIDVADFVEYVFGNASTVMGALRAADGHAAPYKPFAIEIGNEQDHTSPAWIAQVSAFAGTIAATATRLGLPFKIPVLFGVMYGTWPPSQILPLAAAVSGPAFGPLDLMLDFHVGGDNPSHDPVVAFNFIASVRAELANASSLIRGAVLEENGGRHDMQRALGHARNNNRLHCLGDFVRIITAANGLQVVGRNDNSWDQGALFMTPELAYLSPHGMSNIVLRAGLAPEESIVAVESAGLYAAPTLDVIAVVDAARSAVTVRAVNFGASAVSASVSLIGCAVAAGGAAGVVIALNASSLTAQNYPSAPTLVAPAASSVAVSAEGGFDFSFPPFAVVSISVPCAGNAATERRGLGDVPSTCDVPSTGPSNVSALGHIFEIFNGAAWAAAPDSLAVACNAAQCFDEGISVDAPLPASGTAAVSVSFTEGQSPSGDDDAGLLLRCALAGAVPGVDSFSCFEVSLAMNRAGANTGFVLLGAHDNAFALLKQVSVDAAAGVPHLLSVELGVSASSVAFAVSVDGVLVLQHNDSSFLRIDGAHVGLRSFYSDVAFSGLEIISAAT